MMDQSNIYRSKFFGVITFDTTSQALKAEKTLQATNHTFVMIPTPREISASCGLAVKTHPSEVAQIKDELLGTGITIAGVYQLDKSTSEHSLQVVS